MFAYDNGLSSVQHIYISKHFKFARDAMLEKTKFLEHLVTDKWPQEFQCIGSNLLSLTVLYNAIAEKCQWVQYTFVFEMCTASSQPVLGRTMLRAEEA